jgi:uncharacterized protein YbaR (Trm112 family)
MKADPASVYSKAEQMNPELDSKLLQTLRCPVTKSKLTPATPSVIENLNRKIQNGEIANRAGESVAAQLEDGFINEDQTLIFPVRGGIIILTADQAIVAGRPESI